MLSYYVTWGLFMMKVTNIKESLIEQKSNKVYGNLYYASQVYFTYNSNKMEGSRLSEEQMASIFETASFVANKNDEILIDDVIELRNHFLLFDYVLDNINTPLTEDMIIKMNTILKTGTNFALNPACNVGGYKNTANVIGGSVGTRTTPPSKVKLNMSKLLKQYNSLKKVTLEDIIDFHVRFERIHPFEDGNGRVGRIIMFKECLKHNIVPFIILDEFRPFYLNGLRQYKEEKGYLIETCKECQYYYHQLCNKLLDKENNEVRKRTK